MEESDGKNEIFDTIRVTGLARRRKVTKLCFMFVWMLLFNSLINVIGSRVV